MSTASKMRAIADAYTRIAVRLRDLSVADREWLLGQLAPDDCKRVSAALRQHRSGPLDTATSISLPAATAGLRAGQGALTTGTVQPGPHDGGAGQAADPTGDGSTDDGIARFMNASVQDVQPVLSAQPDWAIALVLTAHEWPWAQEFLGALGADRIRALRTVAAELSSRVKPKMRQALVHAIGAKLASPSTNVSQATVPFDAALERAAREWSAFGGLSMSSGSRGGDLSRGAELTSSAPRGEWQLDRL